MNLIATIRAFLKKPKSDSVRVDAKQGISSASCAYSEALAAIEPYSTRANNRYHLTNRSNRILYGKNVSPDDMEAYDEAVAAYTDAGDLESYTETYIEAHSAAMDALSAAFDNCTAALAALSSAHELHVAAAALYEACYKTYMLAVEAYFKMSDCALMIALEVNLQASKDDFEATNLELRAAHNPAVTNRDAAKAEAVNFRAKVAGEAAKAKALEQKAKVAQTKAELFLEKAKSDRESRTRPLTARNR